MKVTFVSLLLLLIVATPVFGQSEKAETPDPERKLVNGFGGHLIVVKDPRAFIEEWLKPQTPNITPAQLVKRGESIGAFVLFFGCKTDAQGVCNAEVDYKLLEPDGTILAERLKQPLWKEKAPPASNTQLSRAILAFRLGEDNPDGEYKIKAKVTDLNANISFDLETKFSLK